MKKKTYGCEDLQGSIYFAPNVLRHCCQRFFVNGKMQGDVEIMKINSDKDLDAQKILNEKKNTRHGATEYSYLNYIICFNKI